MCRRAVRRAVAVGALAPAAVQRARITRALAVECAGLAVVSQGDVEEGVDATTAAAASAATADAADADADAAADYSLGSGRDPSEGPCGGLTYV
jgi:hypothetical protein